MNRSIIVREATCEERPAVAKLTRLAYAEYKSDSQFWQAYESATQKTLLADDTVVRLIAAVEGALLGTVLYCEPYKRELADRVINNEYPEMRLLAVSPEHRNSGVGACLIEACEKRARSEGFSGITLHTTELMQTAKAMYERRGYVRYEKLDFEPVPRFTVWGYIKRFDG